MSAQECPEPADFQRYRNRRAQREPLTPDAVKLILTGQHPSDSEIVMAAYAGPDAISIREHAERLGTTPQEFIGMSIVHTLLAQQFLDDGFEAVLRRVPSYLRDAQTAMDAALQNGGGNIHILWSAEQADE